jgi:deferrochelatase/peroxidase EfeB
MHRRTVLTVAGGVTLAGCSAPVPTTATSSAPSVVRQEHQPGVVTPPPGFLTLVALTVTAAGLGDLLGRLDDRIMRVRSSGTADVTVGVGRSLFDGRFGLGALRPRGLSTMPAFPSDVLDPAQCHGDLLLQVCAAGAEQARSVADDLLRGGSDAVRTCWRLDGFRVDNGTTATGLPSARNLFGFREGAGNPDPGDDALMDRLVWVAQDEPSWAAGGTYQAVRLIRFATELWGREPVLRQEQVLGRRRSDGAPLAGGAEDATFTYAGDPDGLVTPLDAHIRRANPRTAQAEATRILRRGYSYRRGADDGIIFISFQRDLETGFAAAQRRLDGEALQRYVLPFGGGYYFVPPSVAALRAMTTR